MSFLVSCERGSQPSASPMSQPIMNAPVRCTRRAWRMVKGETTSQAAIMMAIARRNSGNPVQEASLTPPNM